jgi:hypothetical protein
MPEESKKEALRSVVHVQRSVGMSSCLSAPITPWITGYIAIAYAKSMESTAGHKLTTPELTLKK